MSVSIAPSLPDTRVKTAHAALAKALTAFFCRDHQTARHHVVTAYTALDLLLEQTDELHAAGAELFTPRRRSRSSRGVDCIIRHVKRREGRGWRLALALRAHRVERRLGRFLHDHELKGLEGADWLAIRETYLRCGGRLVARSGRLELADMKGAP